MGISYSSPAIDFPFLYPKKPASGLKTIKSVSDLIVTENQFITAFKTDAIGAYKYHLSYYARLFINRKKPLIIRPAIYSYLNDIPDNIKEFKPENALIASSGDMGCVYGSVKLIYRNGEASKEVSAGYIHVWKLEDKGWKIVLEMITD